MTTNSPSRRAELSSARRGSKSAAGPGAVVAGVRQSVPRWGRPSYPSEATLLRAAALVRDLGEDGVERLALQIARTHRPNRRRVTIRWRWRIVPVPRLRAAWCTACGDPWVCTYVKLAEPYLPA